MRRRLSLILARLKSIIYSAVGYTPAARGTGPSLLPLPDWLLSSYTEQPSLASVLMSDSITCPQCGMTSYNPNDVLSGWCAKCGGVTQEVKGGHLPWTPQSIWDYIDLPDQAFERMAAGGVWRVEEPRPLIPFVPSGKPLSNRMEVRLVNYKFRGISFGKAEVLGCWEGTNDWQHVGFAEYIG
jgi:ribosomal protein L37E